MKARQFRKFTSEPAFFSSQVSTARRFYLNLQPPRGTRLAVVCGGLEYCAPDYEIHRKSFPYCSIEYVVRGHGTLRLAGRSHPLQPGRLFSYAPRVAHDISSKPEDPLVKYFLDFSGMAALALMRSCRLAPGSVAQVFPPNALSTLFDETISAGLYGGKHGGQLCSSLLNCIAQKISMTAAPPNEAETLAFVTYQNCRAHIDKNFLRLRTLEQIAAECHTNNAYLCRLFRRYDQQTPYQHLLRLKVNYAADRLRAPGALVKQVAEETGFADPLHFSRLFKSMLGLSPDFFRRIR